MEESARSKALAVAGLLAVGAGLSVFGEAVIRKAAARAPGARPWFWLGTASLALVNAGICLVAEAAKRAPRGA